MAVEANRKGRSAGRRRTRTVRVGELPLGGDAPVVIQSMTVADTMDTEATAREVVALARAGCDLVRITTPSIKDAENLAAIRETVAREGIAVPLVADVHFTPNAALAAAALVEKVRINPGNYADRKKFAVREYSDEEYAEELARLEKAFKPLVAALKEHAAALRIGTNHGSLSDRILNRFGDTPLGMAESALEFVRICRRQDFHDIVLSAKASNVRVMVESYRLLARMMDEQGMDYPLHLGVTEAGDGEDGRVKSAVGIGTLLWEGLGDTIRVSLTEDPVKEVPVCREIVRTVEEMRGWGEGAVELWPRPETLVARRPSTRGRLGAVPLGGDEPPRVMVSLPVEGSHEAVDRILHARPGSMAEMVPEAMELRPRSLAEARQALELSRRLRAGIAVLLRVGDVALGRALADEEAEVAIDLSVASLGRDGLSAALRLEPTVLTFVGHPSIELGELGERIGFSAARIPESTVLAFDPGRGSVPRTEGYRALAEATSGRHPILVRATGGSDALIRTSIELGSLLVDGIGDAVAAAVDPEDPLASLRLLYNILQAAGSRVTKTEYISCPSCGRTVFDLESTTARIKERTGHLKGVKIAVMGCIVNGPGEMADADFGYVGASPGTVHLFVGKELVERGIPADEADDRLVELIRSQGRWVDPPAST